MTAAAGRWRTLLPWLAAGLALVVNLLITARLGPLISTMGTATDYAQGAFQLAHGQGYVDCDGQAVSYFPPGYAASLAGFVAAEMSLIDATRWVGALSGAVLAFFTVWPLAVAVRSVPLIVLSVLLVVCNPVLLRWQMELNADAAHAAAVLACLGFVAAYLRDGGRSWLAAATAAVALATMMRFVGVLVFPAAGLFILLFSPHATWRRRLIDGAIFGGVGILPTIVFSFYNKKVSGTAGGPRPIVETSPLDHLHFMADEMSRWMFNVLGRQVRDATPESLRVGVFLALMGLGSIGLVWAMRRASPLVRVWSGLMLAYGVVYVVGLVGIASYVPLDDLGGRFLIPVLIPAQLAVVLMADQLADSAAWKGRLAYWGVVTVFCVALVLPAKITLDLLSAEKSIAINKATAPEVRGHPFVAELRAAAAGGSLVAADPDSRQFTLLHAGVCIPLVKSRPVPQGQMVARVASADLEAGLHLPGLAEGKRPFMSLVPHRWDATRPIGELVRY